jgi:nickel transport protein
MSRATTGSLIAVFVLLASVDDAGAHGLGVGWKARDGRIHLTAFFDDDSTPRNALVLVRDAQKRTVAEGKTDKKGEWSFATPPPGEYEVIVDAGGGHRAARQLIVRETGALDRATEFSDHTSEDAASGTAVTVEGGDRRSDFTAFPWLRLGIGLGAIALVSIAYLTARRLGRPRSGDGHPVP